MNFERIPFCFVDLPACGTRAPVPPRQSARVDSRQREQPEFTRLEIDSVRAESAQEAQETEREQFISAGSSGYHISQ